MRHFLALLTTLSMLHLMLVGGDVACASHGKAGAAMAGMTMGATSDVHGAAAHAHSRTGAAMAPSAAVPATDCSVPTSARCCVAASSCSVTGTVSTSNGSAMADTPYAGTPSVAATRLESVLSAPEPPPPKA